MLRSCADASQAPRPTGGVPLPKSETRGRGPSKPSQAARPSQRRQPSPPVRSTKATKRAAYRGRPSGPGTGVWIFAAILGAILILVVLKLVSPAPAGSGLVSPLDGKPVAPTILADLESVPAAAFTAAGDGGAALPFGGSARVWRAAGGKPVFFYAGGEFCPYCAASRWSLVTALARFGRWSGLAYWNSSPKDVYPGTPTFTLLHAHLKSPYVDFQGLELYSSTPSASGGYQTLQTPDAAQSAVLNKFGVPPYVPADEANGIPFIDIGNRFIWSATLYNPGLLAGLSWSQIAQDVHSGRGPAAQAILANANVLSAAVCAVDGQRPASVCTAPAVRAAAARLPGPQRGAGPVGGGVVPTGAAAAPPATAGHSVIGGKETTAPAPVAGAGKK